ncbi:6-phosphogluconolactonase [Maribacter litopenaei]|uniref:6-phosphogluconolactonase n=1 Tax=Maribacter litopenaei TaxID=2976127 RepID=UPI00308444AB
MELKIYKDKQEVAIAFSKYLADFIGESKTVHIALLGGSTPKIVFDELATSFKDEIDWEKVHFYWGDERCVPPTDDESNYKMTVVHLLSKIDIPQRNIHRVKGEEDPEKEAKSYASLLEKKLPMVEGVPQFDLVILGMGDDGHTASIFPHEIHLWNSDANCEVALHPRIRSTKGNHNRKGY